LVIFFGQAKKVTKSYSNKKAMFSLARAAYSLVDITLMKESFPLEKSKE
jgi:hypothetical protein